MDTSQWPQGIGVVMEGSGGARRARPEKDEALNCPRCNSTNTKFCYYNNYSLSQPRYFCKTCRRYWTNGGSLRNVPVGGGSRKNKRSSNSTPAGGDHDHDHHNSSSKIKLDHNNHAPLGPPNGQNPSNKVQYQGQDLNLAYPQDHFMSKFVVENMPQYHQNPSTTNTASTTTTTTTPAMEVLKMCSPFVSMGGSGDSGGLYNNGFNALQEVKGSGGLSFSLEGMEHGNGARVLFPFEDHVSVRGQGDSTTAAGYWSGMLGGDHGGSW